MEITGLGDFYMLNEDSRNLLAEQGADAESVWSGLSLREKEAFLCGMKYMRKLLIPALPSNEEIARRRAIAESE